MRMRTPDRAVRSFAWVPPAAQAALLLALAVSLVVLVATWERAAPRLGVPPETRRIFRVFMGIVDLALLWRAWRQGRTAHALWRRRKVPPGPPPADSLGSGRHGA